MSLIVETGAGVLNAESLASVADFRAYFASIGTDISALLDVDIERLLRRSTNFMEQRYRSRWAGYKVLANQSLSWPRAWCPIKDAPSGYGRFIAYYSQNQVPKIVINACCELAYKAKDGDLLADQTQQVLSENVAGALSVTYDKSSPQYTRYLAIDAWLEPFLQITGGGMPMVRV
jgi:hypothetical protein